MERGINAALCFCLILLLINSNGSSACDGKDVNRIANVLLEVDDWPGLATELDITAGEQNAIRGNCKEGSSSDVAKCYRRRLVQTYCYSTGLEVGELVENIAGALENIGNKQQAKTLRKLYSSTNKTRVPSPSTSDKEDGSPPPRNGPTSAESGPDYLQSYLDLTSPVLLAIILIPIASVLLLYCVCNRGYGRDPPRALPTADQTDYDGHVQYSITESSSTAHFRGRPRAAADNLEEPVFDDAVNMPSLVYIEYLDRGEVKELRIFKVIAPKWEELASRFDFNNSEIKNVDMSKFHQNEKATMEMFMRWVQRDEEANWRKLILKMREVELTSAAASLAKALRNRVKND